MKWRAFAHHQFNRQYFLERFIGLALHQQRDAGRTERFLVDMHGRQWRMGQRRGGDIVKTDDGDILRNFQAGIGACALLRQQAGQQNNNLSVFLRCDMCRPNEVY